MDYFQTIANYIEKTDGTVSEFEYWGLVTDTEITALLTMERVSRELNEGNRRPLTPLDCASFLEKCIRWKQEVLKAKTQFDPDTTNLSGFFHFIDGVELYRSLLSEKKISRGVLFRYCIELALILQNRSVNKEDELSELLPHNTPMIPRGDIKHAWGNLQHFLSRYHKQLHQKKDPFLFFKQVFPRRLFDLFNDAKDISFPILCANPGRDNQRASGSVKTCILWLNLKLNLPSEDNVEDGIIPLNRISGAMTSRTRTIQKTVRRSVQEAFAFSEKLLEKGSATQSLQAAFFLIENHSKEIDTASIASAALMATVSRITGRYLPPYVCITGKSDAVQNSVDDITARAIASRDHGFKILVFPHESLDELREGLDKARITYEILDPERLGEYDGEWTICPYRNPPDLFRIWRTLTQSQEGTGTSGNKFKSGSNLPDQDFNNDFTGRQEYLKWLHTRFQSGASIAVLTGDSGIGKTQIALQYAGKASQYKLVWRIRGEDRPAIDNSYAELARELNLSQKEFRKEKVIRASVKKWLENNPGWLLIFDNVSSPDNLLDAEVEFLPRGGGNTIITSRHSSWEEWGEQINIKAFKTKESVQYLLKRTGSTDEKGAAALSQSLGNLPLALALSAAYIRESGITVEGYITKFHAERRNITIKKETPPGYPYALATAWRIAIEKIRKRHPNALDLMNIIAFQSPDSIPMHLLMTGQLSSQAPDRRVASNRSGKTGTTRKTIRRLGDLVKKGKPVRTELNWVAFYTNDNIRIEFEEGFRMLQTYSLVSGDFKSISVQNLVQQVTRDNLSLVDEKQWCGLVLNMMMHAFPVSLRRLEDRPKSTILYPHGVSVISHAQRLNVLRNRNLSLIRRLIQYLVDATNYDRAVEILDMAMAIACEIYDESDFQVAWILRLIGDCLKKQQFLEAADAKYREVLNITKFALEAREHDIARDLNNLGDSALNLGRTNDGYRLFKEAVLRLKQGESEKWDAYAASYYHLGRAYAAKASFSKGEEAFEKALAAGRRQFDARHPFNADIHRSLGQLLLHWGKLYPAYEELEAALRIDLSYYGATHPIVALDKNLLGNLFLLDQNLEKAASNLTEASQINQNIYGVLNFHPAIARDQNSIGLLEMEKGRYDNAERSIQQALRIAETIFYQYPEHLFIADIEINYGAVLLEMDELEEGRRHIIVAKQIYERVYGRNHPAHAAVMTHSGWAHHMEGRYDEAKDCFSRAKEILENSCDKNHPYQWIVDQHIQELKKDSAL